MSSGRGDKFTDIETRNMILELLFPGALLSTPNTLEAKQLLNQDDEHLDSSLEKCANFFKEIGCQNVLITGTHENTKNVVNTLLPLSIKIKFDHFNLENLEKLKADLNRMSIIDNYILEKFDINSSFFKIYYFGSPKKLKSELLGFGYNLKNDQGFWKIYINE